MKLKKATAVLSAVVLLGMQALPASALSVSDMPETGILSEEPPMPETFTIQTETMTFEGYADYNSDSVTLIKCDASLTYIEIPAEVTDPETGITYPVDYISSDAFTDCPALREITVNENQTRYQSIDGILCSADGSELIYYPPAKSVESIIIPEGIKKIGMNAFRHHPAKEITLSSGCETVLNYAFGESLEKLNLGESTRAISFSACSNCKNLKEITVPEKNYYFSAEDNVLFNKNKTILYVYPSRKAETSYTVPETVTEIGGGAFICCDAPEEIILPEGLARIGGDNFRQCKNLKTLTIPEGITSLSNIGNDCENLETLYLPSTLTYVYHIFSRCGLKDVYFNNTQDYWYNMSNVRSTAVLTYVTMHFSDDNDYIRLSENGIDYRVYLDQAVVMGCSPELTEIQIPEQVQNVPVTEIHSEAFRNDENLKSVEIPETVISIGYSAFYQSALERVNLPEHLTELGASAFYHTNISEITIPDGITDLNGGMFCGCENLKLVNLPANLKTIGANAFSHCAIEEILIPETVTRIRWNAFQNCSALKEITLPESTAQIEDGVFQNCTNLKKITILNSACQIYDSPGTICNAYSEIELPPEGCIAEIEIHAEFSGIIRGYENSSAQKYAENQGYLFEAIADSENFQSGDVSGDGKITILDVIAVNKAVLGKDTLSETQLKAIDFNQNGKPDSEEALTVLKYIVGLIADFTA